MTSVPGAADAAAEPPALDLDRLRILEIGDRAVFAAALPAATTHVNTGLAATGSDFTLGRMRRLARDLQGGRYDLVVCYPPLWPPWSPRRLLRLVGRRPLSWPAAWLRGLGTGLLALPTATPIAVLDMEDTPTIERHNFALLGRARAYFKRELPPDHWRVFYKTAHFNLPPRRLRRSRRLQAGLAKLRPIALGLPEASLRRRPAEDPPKTVDLFFAGTVEHSSTVRRDGRAQLAALAREGYAVDLVDTPLPLDEYLARMARAWLTWSPEGFGWDCFRHYEAAVCGSVPVMNRPTIHRHRPLLDGVHCLTYDVEGDGLMRTVRAALADRPRLAGMAAAARAHVLAHHTPRRLCQYVVGTCLGGGGDG